MPTLFVYPPHPYHILLKLSELKNSIENFWCHTKISNYFQACADKNLEIAEIQSQEENAAVEKFILLQKDSCNREYFIGLIGEMGNWWWIKSNRNVTYRNFQSINIQTNKQYCVTTILHEEKIKWKNVPCSHQACTLCQKGNDSCHEWILNV